MRLDSRDECASASLVRSRRPRSAAAARGGRAREGASSAMIARVDARDPRCSARRRPPCRPACLPPSCLPACLLLRCGARPWSALDVVPCWQSLLARREGDTRRRVRSVKVPRDRPALTCPRSRPAAARTAEGGGGETVSLRVTSRDKLRDACVQAGHPSLSPPFTARCHELQTRRAAITVSSARRAQPPRPMRAQRRRSLRGTPR